MTEKIDVVLKIGAVVVGVASDCMEWSERAGHVNTQSTICSKTPSGSKRIKYQIRTWRSAKSRKKRSKVGDSQKCAKCEVGNGAKMEVTGQRESVLLYTRIVRRALLSSTHCSAVGRSALRRRSYSRVTLVLHYASCNAAISIFSAFPALQ